MLGDDEPGADLVGERRLELVQLVVEDEVVGELVSELAHRQQLVELLAELHGVFRGHQHSLAVELELDPVGDHPVDEVEDPGSEAGDRRQAVVVGRGVAVGPEAQEPGRELGQLRGLEVERRVAVHQRPHPHQGQPRLRQRPSLGRAEPAAVPGRGPAADAVGLDDSHRSAPLCEVIGAAEAGNAAADDHHPPSVAQDGTPAVTWSSISSPSTANPVTRVVRAGGEPGKCSRNTLFQAPKSPASAR